MIKKITLALLSAIILFLVVAYVTIRAISFKPGFPDNVILAPQAATANRWQGVDSVLLKATDMYRASPYRKILQGKNYREAWDAPIKVPVVWLDSLYGGLKPLKAGGGGQTRSLTLADSEGRMYTLRTICKDATEGMPTFGKRFRLHNLVIDGISAGHPYGALPVAALTEAIGVLHTHPRLVFVPEQTALDTFNHRYGNRLFLLEYEPEGKNGDWTGMDSVLSLMESHSVKDKLIENPLHRADQALLLRIRLFDLVIGDWDRHKGNWGWIAHQKNGTVLYTPFPVDRDMAFYGISGMVPWLLNRPGALENFRPFCHKIDYLPGMLHNSRDFDPFFLNEMSREDFLQAAAQLQQLLTDDVIRQALHTFPDTIFQLNGAEIIDKIIAHRNDLPEYAEAYYNILAQEPQIMGTQQLDSFVIHSPGERQLTVEVFSNAGAGKLVKKYSRTFFSDETKEISLFGWGGLDVFDVRGTLPIRVNLLGGSGKDRFLPKQLGNVKKVSLIDEAGGMEVPEGFQLEQKEVKVWMPVEKP